MALLWVEGFENIGTSVGSAPSPSGVMARKYQNVLNENAGRVRAGRISGYSLQLGNSNEMETPALTTDATLITGFAFQIPTFANLRLISFFDGSTEGMNLRVTLAGELAVYRGASLLATSSNASLTGSTWHYVEMKVLCNNASGTYEVRLDGVTKLSATGQNTKAGTHDYHDHVYFFGGSVSTLDPYLDDWYVCDGSGAANNDFLGNMKVISIHPAGDSGTVQFTPSANGSHWDLVDENPINDSDYVEDTVSGHKDLWTYGTVTGAGSSIAGVQINTCAKITDANSFNLKMDVVSGNTSNSGPNVAVPSSFNVLTRIVEQDPNTTSAWTANGLNAAQFGVEVG